MSNLLNTYAKFVFVKYVQFLIHQHSTLMTASIQRSARKQGPVCLISQLWGLWADSSQMEQTPV